jgi:diacylglycerol kinase (ATP)
MPRRPDSDRLLNFLLYFTAGRKRNSVMESPHKGKTGFQRLINAFGYSIEGLKAAYQNEDAFRQEVLLAAVLLPLAFVLGETGIARALLVGSVLLVMMVELLNSAVEATVDRISLENHLLAKRAKDIGSAAVMLSLVNLAAVWVLVLLG